MSKILQKYWPIFIFLFLSIMLWGVGDGFAVSIKSIQGDKPVMIYNVIHNEFSVIWQLQLETTDNVTGCDLIVYEADGQTVVNANKQSKFKDNGLMQVTVGGNSQPGFTDLVPSTPTALKEYKFRTKATINGADYYYPSLDQALSDQFKVHMQYKPGENNNPFAAPFVNLLYFDIYYETLGNALPNAFVVLKVDIADYPVAGSGASNFGWSADDDYGSVTLNPGNYIYGQDHKFLDLPISGIRDVTIYCLAGKYGQKIITVNDYDPTLAEGTYCLNELDSSADIICEDDGSDKFNAIIVIPNQEPQITQINTGGDIRVVSGKYVVKPGENFVVDLKGTETEAGEYINSWTLSDNKPASMSIAYGSAIGADPNEARITWNPVAGVDSGYEQTITINAFNNTGQSGTATFTVWVTDGRPANPGVSISASPSPAVTTSTLTCSVTGSSTDPLGSPITYTYTWKSGTVEGSLSVQSGLTNATVPASETTKGQYWQCLVQATSANGVSDVVPSTTVQIQNSPATAEPGKPSLSIGPTDATTNTTQLALVGTVNLTGCSDADGDTLGYQLQWYKDGSAVTGQMNATMTADVKKGEIWQCKATLTETPAGGGTTVPITNAVGTSNTITIGNVAPTDPLAANITVAWNDTQTGLVCTVLSGATTDPDVGDQKDTLRYSYDWECTSCSTNPVATSFVAGILSNTLSTGLAKGQFWNCKVAVSDGPTGTAGTATTAYVRSSSADIEITNNKPTWIVVDPVTVTPDPAYNNSTLICQVNSTAGHDDDGDQITYTYQWFKGGVSMGEVTGYYLDKSSNTSFTLTLPSGQKLEQGATYKCEVKLHDSTDYSEEARSDEVTIINRQPSIAVYKANDQELTKVSNNTKYQISVNETEELVLKVKANDPDGNILIYPGPALPSGATYTIMDGDPNWATFKWTPPVGASTAGQAGGGLYTVDFVADETGISSLSSPHHIAALPVEIEVIYPSLVLEDFDTGYTATGKPEDRGWGSINGQGGMERLAKTTDPDDHYMKTEEANTDPNNVSATTQLHYSTALWLSHEEINTTAEFLELQFDIADRNQYSVEIYTHVVTNDLTSKRYVLKYVPKDPVGKVEVQGIYIIHSLGLNKISSAGVTIKRNLEDDVHNALLAANIGQLHYEKVAGIIVRGDINKLDNIKLAKGTKDRTAPKDVLNLTAGPKDGAVRLDWDIPTNQDADIYGYRIETYQGGVIQEEKCLTVSTLTTSKLISGLNNNTPYSFKVFAYDDAETRDTGNTKIVGNMSAGAGPVNATPSADQTAPTWSTNPPALSGVSGNNRVTLNWIKPTDADVDHYDIYKDGTKCGTAVKTAITYDVTGLTNGTSYTFLVKVYDDSGNNRDSNQITVQPDAPQEIVFDNFDNCNPTPSQSGWSILQGSGTVECVNDTTRDYLKLNTTSSSNKLNFIATKFVGNPDDYTNGELNLEVKGNAADFEIDLYVAANNGKKYFIKLKPSSSYSSDQLDANPLSGLYIKYYLGWANRNSNTWYHVTLNLNEILKSALGQNVSFTNFLGMVSRGIVSVDEINFKKAVPEVKNVIARAGSGEVELSWTCSSLDIEHFYVGTKASSQTTWTISADIVNYVLIDGNQCAYTVTGLTNGTDYNLKVFQGVDLEGNGTIVKSNGIEVTATPRAYGFTEDCDDLSNWQEVGQDGYDVTVGSFTKEYNAELHSEVLVVKPLASAVYSQADGGDPLRYFVERPGINLSGGKSMVTMRVKADNKFILWFKVWDASGVQYDLVYLTGGTQTNRGAIGTWAYAYLGNTCPADGGAWTDGKWHTITLDLNDLLKGTSGTSYDGYYGSSLLGVDSLAVGGYSQPKIDGQLKIDDIAIY